MYRTFGEICELVSENDMNVNGEAKDESEADGAVATDDTEQTTEEDKNGGNNESKA